MAFEEKHYIVYSHSKVKEVLIPPEPCLELHIRTSMDAGIQYPFPLP